jgi:hypothetical protein
MNPYADAAADLANERPTNRYGAAAAELAEGQRAKVRANAMAASATAPDAAASAARLGRAAGLPLDFVQRNQAQVQQRVTAERIDTDTADAPTLRGRYADAGFASLAHDDSRNLSYLERITTSFRRGLTSAQQGGDASGVRDAADILNVIDRIERGELTDDAALARATPFASMFAGAGRTPQALAKARARAEQLLATNAAEFVARGGALQALPRSADMERFQSSKGWRAAFGALADAPVSIASQLVAQSSGTMLPSLPFVVAGGVAGGARGLAAATGATSSATEYVTALAEAFGKLGVDPRDRDAVLAAVRSPEFAELNRQAQVKAGIVGAFDAATAGVAGVRLAAGPVRNLSAQAGVQAAGGAAGEAAGSVAIGEEINAAAVLSEAFGEVPSAMVDVAVMAGRRAVQRNQSAQAAMQGAQQIGELVKAADASALKARDPQTFGEFVGELQPEATVYVAPEHLQGVDLSAVPEIAAQAQEAAATGGDVAIPLADLLAHLPGEQLLPHLRTEPDAMTANEAQQLDEPAAFVADLAATDEQLVKSPEQAGMDADTWAQYQQAAAAAAQSAIEAREARSMRDMQWLANATSKEARRLNRETTVLRKAIEAEVTTEIESKPETYPEQAVQRWLKTGVLPGGSQTVGAKLNTAALREIFGDGPAAPWRYLASNMLTNEQGLHADVVAEMFGYASGEQMVRQIVASEPAAELVARLVDERMSERHADLVDEVKRTRMAEAAVSDDARQRFLATEAAALARAVGNRVLLQQEAKRYAEESIARRKVGELRPALHAASAERAGKAAEVAFAKGDTALAAKRKQGQVLQTALHREATGAAAEVSAALATFKRMAKDDQHRDGNLSNTARAVLAMYGLGEAEKTPADYLAQVEHYDPELHADLQVLMQGLPAPAADHRSLTMADFREVRDRVQAIWSLARSTREIEIDGQRVAIKTAAAELAQQLEGEKPAKREQIVGRNEHLDLRMRLSGIRAGLRRVEHWADASGPFRKYVWQPISEAVTKYRDAKQQHVGRFLELLKTIEPTLKPGKIAAPELADGAHFADRSALLHALLHTGNASNRKKLLLGYGWAQELEDGSLDTTRWDRFLARMHAEKRITAADWQFVQATWDLLEAMKPDAQAAHKRMFGAYFAEITADPVETPFGPLRGGYVPALTDSLLVPEARTHGATDDMLASQSSPMFPAVARGFTKGRIESYTRPLALDLRLLPAHLDKVAKFATLGPVLRDTTRLVTRNREFRAAMDAVDPTAIESMLVPWLKRTAQQSLTAPPQGWSGRAVARVASTLRNRTGLILMAGNVVNTLQQITGLSVAALRVNPRHLAGGMWQLLHAPQASADAINELSPWMRQRSEGGARDIEQAIDDLVTNPSARQRVEQLGTRYGYVLQQAAQNVLDRLVWLGAYRQAQADGVDGQGAVRQADAAVRMTLSSFAPEDSAAVEHQTAFVRLFLQFASYFNSQGNLLATEVQNARTPGRLALVYMLGFAIPAFVADVIAKGARGELGEDEDDDLTAQLLGAFFLSQARYALAMLPVAGQAGNAALGQLTPDRFDDRIGASPAYSALEATVRAPRSVYRAIEGEGNPRTAVRDGLTAVGVLTGLPVGPLVRPLGYLADDEADPQSPIDAARGLITGKP